MNDLQDRAALVAEVTDLADANIAVLDRYCDALLERQSGKDAEFTPSTVFDRADEMISGAKQCWRDSVAYVSDEHVTDWEAFRQVMLLTGTAPAQVEPDLVEARAGSGRAPSYEDVLSCAVDTPASLKGRMSRYDRDIRTMAQALKMMDTDAIHRGDELKSRLQGARVNASAAKSLVNDGRRVGHTLHMMCGRPSASS